jgi:peptide/nickel transport system permease protein
MWIYILRRILYAIPILIGVNIITFALFFFVNTPNDIANIHLGGKYVTQEARDNWKKGHGYHQPLFYNEQESGVQHFSETIFFQKSLKLFVFDFGVSDMGRDIIESISKRAMPSLLIAVPTLILGLVVNIIFSVFLVMCRHTRLDSWGVLACVMLMSISALFYIVLGQFVFAKVLKWMPISGYVDGWACIKFLLLPIIVGVISGMGSESRWYRTLLLEEIHKDYVRTARAKGLSEYQTLIRHVLRNALIPIMTGIVVILPLLFLGSLLTESFFGIPGLGSYTIDAIRQQDFAIVRVMVFLGTLLYMLGLLLTEISYVIVDPRVRLE